MPERDAESFEARSAMWPIVVGGCHRSGTSVLRRSLDAHSRIHCGPEVKFFRDFYGDYFADDLAPYRFLQTARSLLPEDDLLEVVGKAFVTLHERAARRAGKQRWADKAPENVLYAKQWQQLLGEKWLLIHIVRNPLDTLASMEDVRFPRTFPPGLEERIAFYRRYTEAGLSCGIGMPERYFRIVYEELVASPAAVLGRLMAWLGESLEPAQLVFNSVEHQPGLEDPRIDETTQIHDTSVDRWRSRLAPRAAATAWAATEDLWARIDPEGTHWSPSADIVAAARL
jgi:hypothetical protein